MPAAPTTQVWISKDPFTPNGVINQSFYRDGSHKHPASLSKSKMEKKESKDKGLGSKAEGKTTIFVQRGWSGAPERAQRLGEPIL